MRIFSTQECGIDVNPLRKERFTKAEMIRKFCLGEEYSSVKSELRTPNRESEKQPRVEIQDYLSRLIITITLNSEWDAP